MNEIIEITAKYTPSYVEGHFQSLEGLHKFSLHFFKDVADIYDVLTRVRNTERNPSGYSIDDAPILGLLVSALAEMSRWQGPTLALRKGSWRKLLELKT